MGGVRWFGTAAFVLLAGCDLGSPDSEEAWQVEVVSEPDGSISRFGPILVETGRQLSPWSVDRGTVRLTSASVGELVFPAFDPIAERLEIDLARPLLEDTSYLLRLEGLRDLDGTALTEPIQLLLHASDASRVEAREPVQLERVLTLLKSRCADGGCHDAKSRASGLVLDSVAGIRTTALDTVSSQSLSPSRVPERRGEGLVDLAIVDSQGGTAGVSRSYLIYKVLGDTHALGEAMPPARAGPPLTDEETDLLASWIADGAALE